MTAYFPIPPSITFDHDKGKIIGSITFLNYPNNRLKSILKKNRYSDIVYLGLYCFRNKKWFLLRTFKCNPIEFIEISRSKLDVEDHEMVVAVPKKLNIFKENYDNLPAPDLLKIDNSNISQRASLNFSYLNSTTSYQGEYPFIMSDIKKGSLLTFDSLKQTNFSSNKNFLILMNISNNFNSLEPIKIEYFNPKNRDKIKIVYARRNYFSVFKSSEYESYLDNPSTIFFRSNEVSFIPLMLSIDINTNQLSVEHTHPPSEYFFGFQKLNYVNLIKKQWIN